MKIFLSLLFTKLNRAILSKSFVVSVLGVVVITFIASLGILTPGTDVLGILVPSLVGSGTLFAIIGIFPLFPFANSFVVEWEQKAIHFWIIRVGIKKYVICKIIAIAISSFLVTATGLLTYSLFLLLKFPLHIGFGTGDAFGILLLNQRPYLYLLYFVIHISLGSTLLAIVGFGVSTIISDKFTTIASPLVIYFFMSRFTSSPVTPGYLQVVNLVEGIYNAGSPNATIFVKFIIIFIICTMITFGCIFQIKRRLHNG